MLNFETVGNAVSNKFLLLRTDPLLRELHQAFATEVIKARSLFHSGKDKNYPDLFARQEISKEVELTYLRLKSELEKCGVSLPEV